MRICVTGATGFVGSALVQQLLSLAKHEITVIIRNPDYVFDPKVKVIYDKHTFKSESLAQDLSGTEVVVHAAARAHVMKEKAQDPMAEFHRVNTQGTLDLAKKASVAGVKRFIFLSSIKVNGEVTRQGHPFNVFSKESPVGNYALSKYEAELGLRRISVETGMEVTIIRAPLIYGKGVKGNFKSLLWLVSHRIPLPFGSITNNRRSMLSLDNLISLILLSILHKNAANQTFLASDGEDMSTALLIRTLGQILGVSTILIPIPQIILRFLVKLFQVEPQAQRLLGNLQVDISHTKNQLGWEPKLDLHESLSKIIKNGV